MIDNERLAATALQMLALQNSRFTFFSLPASIQTEATRRIVTPGVTPRAGFTPSHGLQSGFEVRTMATFGIIALGRPGHRYRT